MFENKIIGNFHFNSEGNANLFLKTSCIYKTTTNLPRFDSFGPFYVYPQQPFSCITRPEDHNATHTSHRKDHF